MGRVHTDKSCLPVPLYTYSHPRSHPRPAIGTAPDHGPAARPGIAEVPPPSLSLPPSWGISPARPRRARRLRTGVTRLARWKRKTRLPEARVRIQPCLLSWPSRARSISLLFERVIIMPCYATLLPPLPRRGCFAIHRQSGASPLPPFRYPCTIQHCTYAQLFYISWRRAEFSNGIRGALAEPQARRTRGYHNCCAPSPTAESSRCVYNTCPPASPARDGIFEVARI